jgi:hypothetical protein
MTTARVPRVTTLQLNTLEYQPWAFVQRQDHPFGIQSERLMVALANISISAVKTVR